MSLIRAINAGQNWSKPYQNHMLEMWWFLVKNQQKTITFHKIIWWSVKSSGFKNQNFWQTSRKPSINHHMVLIYFFPVKCVLLAGLSNLLQTGPCFTAQPVLQYLLDYKKIHKSRKIQNCNHDKYAGIKLVLSRRFETATLGFTQI